MPGFAILGDGEIDQKYLIDTLSAFRDAAGLADEEFFLVVPYILTVDKAGDEILTNAIADTFEWVEAEEIWTRVFAAKDEPEEEQPTVEEFKVVKRGSVYQAVVKDIINEGGELLVLPHTMDWDEPDERDVNLIEAITAANQNGVTVKQLNNGLIELDLTAVEEPDTADDDSPSEQDVRDLGEAADKGDDEAATKLAELGAEYSLDIEEEPYKSMSWEEFSEAILTTFAEQENAGAPQAPADVQPQAHDWDELRAKQVRTLRSMAIAEGWGNPSQGFPKWFLVKHLAEGTVPTKDQLSGKEQVPDTEPDGSPDMADVAGEPGPEAPRGRRSAKKGTEPSATGLSGLLAVAAHLEGAAGALRAWAEGQG